MAIVTVDITAYLIDTGLTVTLDGYKTDGTQALDDVSMDEIGDGFYVYRYSNFDTTKDYVFLATESGGTKAVGSTSNTGVAKDTKTSIDNLYYKIRDWARKTEVDRR